MNASVAFRFSIAATALALLACSGGGGGDSRNRWDLKMGPPADMTMGPPPYPMGPYGNQMGSTMANIKLSGYRLTPSQTDSSQLSWDTTIALSDYHNNPACKCLLITVGATWCGACQEEQPGITSDVMGDPGFCVLGVLQDGPSNGTPATMSDVTDWTQQYRQDFAVVQGSNTTENLFQGWGQGNPPTIGLPFNLIVTPSDMKVVGEVEGFRSDIHSYAMGLCGGN